jgi:RNA polymerase sigma factor (TIGR02999 family)
MHKTPQPAEITRLLHRASQGDEPATNELFQLVYGQLRRIARSQRRRGGPGSTLNTTGLVHEAYLKLFRGAPMPRGDHDAATPAVPPTDREHFYALAARAMRHILVDSARAHRRDKRGGGLEHVELQENEVAVQREAEQIMAVHQALDRLNQVEERLALAVECRFFAGLTNKETAVAMAVSERTAERCWHAAQAWLRSELTGPTAAAG